MLRETIANDTVDSFLSRHVGSYSDTVEQEFLILNPDVVSYGLYLPANLTLEIPDVRTLTSVKRRTAWD